MRCCLCHNLTESTLPTMCFPTVAGSKATPNVHADAIPPGMASGQAGPSIGVDVASIFCLMRRTGTIGPGIGFSAGRGGGSSRGGGQSPSSLHHWTCLCVMSKTCLWMTFAGCPAPITKVLHSRATAGNSVTVHAAVCCGAGRNEGVSIEHAQCSPDHAVCAVSMLRVLAPPRLGDEGIRDHNAEQPFFMGEVSFCFNFIVATLSTSVMH